MVAIDQAIFPTYVIGSYLFWANLLQFQDVKRAVNNVQEKFFEALKVNYIFWPAINFVNFKYIPIIYRTLYVNFFATFWNGFLAYQNAKHTTEYKVEEVKEVKTKKQPLEINKIPEVH